MPKINVGLFATLIGILINVGVANAEVTNVYSGTCYNRGGAPGNGYYVVDYAVQDTSYSSLSSIPAITTVYPTCTSGTRYEIYPAGQDPDLSGTDVYATFGIIYSCTACADGYELTLDDGPYIYGSSSDKVECTSFFNIDYIQKCVAKLSSGTGTTCTSSNCKDSGISVHSASVVKKIDRSCTTSTTCTETTLYTCNKGYFGILGWSTSSSGCNQCPPYILNGTQYTTTTTTHGIDNVSGCYVEAVEEVTEFNEASGTFVMAAPYGPAADANRCQYDLGNCSSYTGVCSTISGTSYAVVSGTKANSTSGTYCWCNTNGKSFMVANMGTYASCSQSCKSACATGLLGFPANDWVPMVSWTDLGC